MKLDFSNVLIRPKRSTISSRSEVDLERNFNFYSKNKDDNVNIKWKGVPIIAANMDTIGTFEVYDKLKEHKIVTALHKHYSLEDWKTAIGDGVKMKYLSVCTGTGVIWDKNAPDYATMKEVLKYHL